VSVLIQAWFLLLVAVLGMLSTCESLRDLEGFARRHHGVLSEAFPVSWVDLAGLFVDIGLLLANCGGGAGGCVSQTA